MNQIKTNEEFVLDMQKNKLQVFVFTGIGCPDCAFIKPFMPEIEKEFPDIDFHEVSRDDLMDLTQDLGVMGIPSFLAFKDGHEVTRFVSTLRKTKGEIEDYLKMTVNKEG